MDVPKPVIRVMKFFGWLFAGAAITALSFVAISGIVWFSHWLASYFPTPVSETGPELPFSAFGFHGHVLLAIAAIGLPIALWRGYATHKQSEAALEQSGTAQSDLLNERYQKGVDMLGSEDSSVRLGGIYALERLAENEPDTYYIQIMSVFSAFVRNWLAESGLGSEQNNGASDTKREPPEDVCAILEVIGRRNSKQHKIEAKRKYVVDLSGAHLCGWSHDRHGRITPRNFSHVYFFEADLSEAFLPLAGFAHANFMYADLSNTWLMLADLSNADFIGADLSDAGLGRTDLSSASFEGAKLFGTDLTGAKGLTQEQLNSAKIDLQRPPVLTDAVDPITGQPLVVPVQKPAP